jgi:hypothetical protein
MALGFMDSRCADAYTPAWARRACEVGWHNDLVNMSDRNEGNARKLRTQEVVADFSASSGIAAKSDAQIEAS